GRGSVDRLRSAGPLPSLCDGFWWRFGASPPGLSALSSHRFAASDMGGAPPRARGGHAVRYRHRRRSARRLSADKLAEAIGPLAGSKGQSATAINVALTFVVQCRLTNKITPGDAGQQDLSAVKRAQLIGITIAGGAGLLAFILMRSIVSGPSAPTQIAV